MAGFVHITDDVGLSMSTISFNAIIEFPRRYFDSSFKDIELEIYEPVDEGGMSFISLADLDSEGLKTFYCGLTIAYDKCKSEGQCGNLENQFYERAMGTWVELLDLIRTDDRFIHD